MNVTKHSVLGTGLEQLLVAWQHELGPVWSADKAMLMGCPADAGKACHSRRLLKTNAHQNFLRYVFMVFSWRSFQNKL